MTMLTHNGKPIATKKFTPIERGVAVQIINTTNRSPGGVVLPDVARGAGGGMNNSPVCVVIAVGPDVKTVKEGDLILGMFRQVVEKIFFDGDELLVLQEQQIVGPLLSEVADRYRKLAEQKPENGVPSMTDQIKGKRMAETS
jgi:co-chaperonin GroES (HSP10)